MESVSQAAVEQMKWTSCGTSCRIHNKEVKLNGFNLQLMYKSNWWQIHRLGTVLPVRCFWTKVSKQNLLSGKQSKAWNRLISTTRLASACNAKFHIEGNQFIRTQPFFSLFWYEPWFSYTSIYLSCCALLPPKLENKIPLLQISCSWQV